MTEKLLPLKIPPGLVNNGTAYQQSGRWWDGNLVRFFQGSIQPVGGWTAESLTGDAIVGVPRAALAWQTNTGASYLAVGTTEALYVIDANNVVYDISPSVIVGEPGADRVWQLALFGSYLVAVPSRGTPLASLTDGCFIWLWRGDTAVACERADSRFDLTGGVWDDPYGVHGVAVTPERFLLALCGDDPDGFIRAPLAVN